MAGSRMPYSLAEDKKILRYIIDGQFEPVVKGNAVWIKMEEDNLCPDRSWQSMKNRFKRHIMLDFSRPEFGLTHDEKVSLKAHLSSSMSDVKPAVKRNTDVRLIKSKLEKRNSSESVNPETNNLVTANITSGDESSDESSSSSSLKILETNNSTTRREDPPLTPPDKYFYSLDMQWSDSD